MKRAFYTIAMLILSLNLNAQASDDSRAAKTLPCIMIHAQGTLKDNFQLINIRDNSMVPLIDLSRQFIAPGTYSLRHQLWGYRNYSTEFLLEYGDEKIIDFTPAPVDSKLLKKYARTSHLKNISLFTTLAALGGAGLFKVMGDSEYDKYKAATATDEIAQFRNSSNIYQIACYSSSSLCISSAATWILTSLSKKSTNRRILAAMQR